MTIISNHQQLLRFTGMVLLMIDMRRNTGYGGPQYIDGDDLREQAVALGLLELRTIDSPCRPSCACDRFPAQCYFLTPLGEQAVAEMDAPPDDADLPTLASFEGVAPNAVLVDAIGDTTTPAQLLAERDRLRAEVDRLNAVLDQADAVTRRIDAAVDRATENATRLIAERDKLRALLAEALPFVRDAGDEAAQFGLNDEADDVRTLADRIAAALPQVAD